MPTTLVVTNDFPPRIGGIESFVARVCTLLDDDVVVYASGPPGAEAGDRDRGYPVVRAGAVLLPTPATARRTAEVLRAYGASRVLFGAAAPLGLLAPALRRAGAEHLVALTHGHEVWWAALPPTRPVLRRIGDGCDHLTTISDYTAGRIAPALSPAARDRLLRLPPPVDLDVFHPAAPGLPAVPPRVVAVARFVRQKGLDTLLRAWAPLAGRADVAPPSELVLVGAGPQLGALRTTAVELGIADRVRFTGPLPPAGVAAELRRASVFALPVRTRLAGLNPEGFGLAALEAAACGLPVLVGDSGGAAETVRDGVTGWVLPSQDVSAWTERLATLLGDPAQARAAGAQGRAWVEAEHGPDRARATLRRVLHLGTDPG